MNIEELQFKMEKLESEYYQFMSTVSAMMLAQRKYQGAERLGEDEEKKKMILATKIKLETIADQHIQNHLVK
jgi:hypothetical protein